MGKKKIRIEMIQDKNKRHVCFSKRRKGLFQKASELCTLCDAQVGIIVFSGGGRPFVFGHPTADAVIGRFLSATDPVPPDASHSSHSHSELIFNRVAKLQQQLEVVKQQQKKKSQLPMKDEEFTNWWEQVLDLDEGVTCVEELERVKERLESFRSKVLERINRFYTASSTSSSSSSSAAACGKSVCPPKTISTQSGPLVTMADEDEWIYGELSEIDSACYL